MKTVYVLLFNGYSDWEIAYVMPELRKSKDYVLKTFTIDGTPVTSVGGLNVSPDTSLQELYSNGDLAAIVLAGGEAWEKNEIRGIDELVRKAADENKIVAAICAATTYLGKLGLLDRIKHTSNDLKYLKYYVPEYKGENNYQSAFAVTDKNIITANGTAPVEFAREIFKALNLYNEEDTEKWFQLFKNGVWVE
jgi:putative intracellular protease/amidase